MSDTPRRVRDRIFLRLSAEEARDEIRRDMRPLFGRLGGSWVWLRYEIAPTTEGCVVEIVDHRFPLPIALIRVWLLPGIAGALAITNLSAALLRLSSDFTLLGLSAFLLVFEGIILGQSPIAAIMYGQYLRERFQKLVGGPAEITGPPLDVRR